MKWNTQGQVAIWIILAIVIVGGVLTYVVVQKDLLKGGSGDDFDQVFSYYEQCIAQETAGGLDFAGSLGGRIESGSYIPGSEYAPFSSHLDFLGFPVKYWYGITGNGLIREDVPTLSEIEGELGEFVQDRLQTCDFDSFRERGMSVEVEEVTVNVRISDKETVVDASSMISVSNGIESRRKGNYHVRVPSAFGSLYKEARDVYTYEKRSSFLENYSVDVLRLYAPVDGVEISCAPKVWKSRDVVSELRTALQANIGNLRFSTGIPSTNKDAEYFTIEGRKEHDVTFLYSPTWPSKIEIEGGDGELLIANPVGIQEGLGILGFCYAPYHFVYDVSYPVMVQLREGDEVFQFPVVVVIDNNIAREGEPSEYEDALESPDVCSVATQDIAVKVMNRELERVDATVSYSCFDQRCGIGVTQGGEVRGKIPACVNGQLQARAEGYFDAKELFSSNEENNAEIILDRKYVVNVSVLVDGKETKDQAMVSFEGAESLGTLLPDNPSALLREGLYNVTVWVYGNSSVTLPESKSTQCVDVPQGGFAGFFGATDEECYDLTVPATKIEKALAGGGKSEVYFFEDQLKKGNIELHVSGLPRPNSLEQLQKNYQSFDGMGVEAR